MRRSKLVTLLFSGGGPWDGQELTSRSPVDAEFAMVGGRYRLYDTTPSQRRGDGATALYWWAPRVTEELEAGRVTWYPVLCRFPGCERSAPLMRADERDGIPLCYDHTQLLFYDLDEFLRLWELREVGGVRPSRE